MLRFLLVMVPLVFVINGFTKGNWAEAFFFAIAVAVGLTPEMLPMIVTVCLSKGALAMSRKKVIVKRINAIQNLGAMDVLCTDKTGTLTMDCVILERYCDVVLKEDEGVLALAYLNSHFQTGLKNVLDRAVLAHSETHAHAKIPEHAKVDEIPFDFQRRIMSVVVRTPEGKDRIISTGAPEAISCALYDFARSRCSCNARLAANRLRRGISSVVARFVPFRRSEKQTMKSPYRTIAHFLLPRQEIASLGQQPVFTDLSFNVWHELAAHRPLGGINRVRRLAYPCSSAWRGQQQG
jgi:magnesium-transporting ATPase (P-type)